MQKCTRIITMIFLLFLNLPLLAAGSNELIFLNWGDYMDPEVLQEFKKRTGITVKETYFESDTERNDILVATDGKGYDFTVVDGVTLQVLANRGWLDPVLDKTMPNVKHIDSRWRKGHPMAKTYGVPFFWGTTGIAYRKDLVKKPVTSWMDLFRPDESLRGKIGMVTETKEAVGLAMKALGHPLNSPETSHLKEVEKLLAEQAPYVKTYKYVSLDKDSSIVSGDIAMAILYNGDTLMVQEFNENIAYVLPKEGGIVWIDYLAIMSSSTKKDKVRKFINFLNEPEIAARLADYLYFATPNNAAKALMSKEYLEHPVIYPGGPALEKSELLGKLPARANKRRESMMSRIVR